MGCGHKEAPDERGLAMTAWMRQQSQTKHAICLLIYEAQGAPTRRPCWTPTLRAAVKPQASSSDRKHEENLQNKSFPLFDLLVNEYGFRIHSRVQGLTKSIDPGS